MAAVATRRHFAAAAAASPPATLSSLFRSRHEKPKRLPPLPPPPSWTPAGERRGTRPRRPDPEAAGALVRRLRDGDYLTGPDLSSEPRFYSPHLVKAAAERFGHDHQEIAKWLSGCHLKKVALFGCPSVERKTVFASKRLRAFFSIQEDKICGSCKLKSSCKFVNQRIVRHDKVILADTMRILTLFALDAISRPLRVPADLKSSVNKLLKDTVNLSS